MSWELTYSVVANASRQVVWEFISNVDNLARFEGDAVESITLDGPYQAGAKGTTTMRGQEPTYWRLVEVIPPERTVTEIPLTDAVIRFSWTYDELSDGRTRMTQQIMLEGPGAEAYVPVMEARILPPIALAESMERLADEITRFATSQ